MKISKSRKNKAFGIILTTHSLTILFINFSIFFASNMWWSFKPVIHNMWIKTFVHFLEQYLHKIIH